KEGHARLACAGFFEAEPLIEGRGLGDVGDAERHEADMRRHEFLLMRVAPAWECCPVITRAARSQRCLPSPSPALFYLPLAGGVIWLTKHIRSLKREKPH